jgi:hypothetical protein
MTTPVDRFSMLSVRQGITLGALYSASRDDFALVLAAAGAAFASDRTYTEREVNVVLRDWLATAGTMLDVDHVELRRWLVDNRLLDRDGFGRAYAAGSPAPAMAAFVAALSGVDLADVARTARERDARVREERKRDWAVGHRAGAKQPAPGNA